MTGFDMTESIVPRSDQLNAEDLLTGPRTFTIERVSKGSTEQPVDVHLVENPGRPFKPSKTVRRLMVGAWGSDASAYVGKRMTLYRDPDVRFGGMATGGIRVSHMSHIDKPLTMVLAISKGKRAPYVVKPLVEAPIQPVNPPEVPSRGPSPTDVLMAALKTAGLTEAGPALAFISETVGREVKATKELTADEVNLVVHELTNAPAGDQ